MSFDAKIGYDDGRANSLLALSEVALRERKLSEADKHLDDARELAMKMNNVSNATMALSFKSALAANQGRFALARDLINRAIEEATYSDEVSCVYVCCYFSTLNPRGRSRVFSPPRSVFTCFRLIQLPLRVLYKS
jgi:hypothetical protein